MSARINPGKIANPGEVCKGKGAKSNILHL